MQKYDLQEIPKQKISGIPLIGLGTWRLYGSECERTVKQALDLGYRHIDTADIYENHSEIGKAIKGFPRDQLFLTTKLATTNLHPNKVREVTIRCLKELGVNEVDLLLVHWPEPDMDLPKILQAMLTLKEEGLAHFIGVSNFVRSHLKEIEPYHFPILTNQIELHPYLQRNTLVSFCEKMGITITAYSPLAKGAVETDPVLKKIGKKYGKSPSQIVLRWLIEKNIAVIPKASSLKHLKDNFFIFDFCLDANDHKEILQLDKGKFCSSESFSDFED